MKEEKKNKSKILKMVIAIVAITISIMLANSTNTYAVLQANPTTHGAPTTNTGAGWILQVRTMEATGGTMGLNATYDSNSSNTLMESASNNIDVHMIKSTEWGAVEILAASGYGARSAPNIQNVTTTNNSTGVYFNGSTWEWVAGVASKAGTVGNSVNGRYYDNYGTTSDTASSATNTSANGGPKAGDGLGSPTLSGAGKYPGCFSWNTAGKASFIPSKKWFWYEKPGFVRGGVGLFSYTPFLENATVWNDSQDKYACRGVAVVGQDL